MSGPWSSRTDCTGAQVAVQLLKTHAGGNLCHAAGREMLGLALNGCELGGSCSPSLQVTDRSTGSQETRGQEVVRARRHLASRI